MKQKTTLSLMELAVMIAVFALAATVCLRAFVWADARSRRSQAESRAAELCQSTAELLKAAKGNYDFGLERHYDADFQSTADGDYAYCLTAAPLEPGLPGLGRAAVSVTDSSHTDTLFSLEVCWQEPIEAEEGRADA